MTEEIDLGEIVQRAQQAQRTLDEIRQWSSQQAADLRGKIELVEELEEQDIEIDLDELDSVPAERDKIESVAEMLDELNKRID